MAYITSDWNQKLIVYPGVVAKALISIIMGVGQIPDISPDPPVLMALEL